MGSLNRVTLIGNLGRDAELRYTQGGDAVSTINIATTQTWKDKGGNKKERTEWHRVVIWGKVAEALSEYLVKGKQVAVEGQLQTRKWTDKDGTERYTTEIRASNIVLLGGGGSQQSSGGGGGAKKNSGKKNGNTAPAQDDGPDDPLPGESGDDDDDVPFSWLMPLIGPLTAATFYGSMLV